MVSNGERIMAFHFHIQFCENPRVELPLGDLTSRKRV